MSRIIDRHRVFADAYLASRLHTKKDRIAEAEVIAGYKPGGGARILRLPDVREYIEHARREMEKAAESIIDMVDSEEITALINSIVAEYKDSDNFERQIEDSTGVEDGEGKECSNVLPTHRTMDLSGETGASFQEYLEREIKEFFEKRQIDTESQKSEIAGSEKVAAFFTAVMNAGDPERFSSADLRDQMKAAEFLAKYHGMFSKEQADKEQVQPVIISGDDSIES